MIIGMEGVLGDVTLKRGTDGQKWVDMSLRLHI